MSLCVPCCVAWQSKHVAASSSTRWLSGRRYLSVLERTKYIERKPLAKLGSTYFSYSSQGTGYKEHSFVCKLLLLSFLISLERASLPR